MYKIHFLENSMVGIGIYEFLFLSLAFSKMCYEALNSYSNENTETTLFYSFLFMIILNHQKGKKKKKSAEQNKVAISIFQLMGF